MIAIEFEYDQLPWMTVESSAMRRVAHEARGLWVEFVSGEIYLYRQVPRHLVDQFMASDSLGRFLNDHIRDRFPFDHIFLAREN